MMMMMMMMAAARRFKLHVSRSLKRRAAAWRKSCRRPANGEC